MLSRLSSSPVVELIRSEPRAGPFFFAHAQSSLGNGAACIALLVLAYERFHSPWAITVILLADLVPAMVLGPLLGALTDRCSRRRCAVVADVMRAVAFVGVALAGSFEAMVAFALVAGLGTALFRPAVMAGLPSLVDERRQPAATSLFGAIEDLGYTLGPALAAGLLLVAGADVVSLLNGASFAVSALILARAPFGQTPARSARAQEDRGPSLLTETREGLHAATIIPGIRTLILGSSGMVLFAGLINVGELLLAGDELGAGPAGYAILVGAFGLGVAGGSLCGARGGTPARLKHRYLTGMLLLAAGAFACGLAPTYQLAVISFALAGVGNGLILVHERLLLQAVVPDRLTGRVFAVKDMFQCWAFLPGLVGASVLISLLGTRPLFLIAGAGILAVWFATVLALRDTWTEEPRLSPARQVSPAVAV